MAMAMGQVSQDEGHPSLADTPSSLALRAHRLSDFFDTQVQSLPDFASTQSASSSQSLVGADVGLEVGSPQLALLSHDTGQPSYAETSPSATLLDRWMQRLLALFATQVQPRPDFASTQLASSEQGSDVGEDVGGDTGEDVGEDVGSPAHSQPLQSQTLPSRFSDI